MNVNQKKFPPQLKKVATSLRNEFKTCFNRIDIIAGFLAIFEKEYLKMIS